MTTLPKAASDASAEAVSLTMCPTCAPFSATSPDHQGYCRKVGDAAILAALPHLGEPVAVPRDRDELGRVVREAWVCWAQTQPEPKGSWLVPYADLLEVDKEADRQIGEALALYLAPPAPDIPAGWKLVPVDATDAMVKAALDVDGANEDEAGTVHNVWHAMLAAAPKPPAADHIGEANKMVGPVNPLMEQMAAALVDLLGHSGISDVDDHDKDPEDISAEKQARAAIDAYKASKEGAHG